MNKKNIILALLAVLALAGLMWWGRSNQANVPSRQEREAQSESSSKPLFSATEKFYDFGIISMANGKVSRVFEVSNKTDKDINLEKLTTSCMCTEAYIVNGDSRRGPFGMPGHIAVPKANEIIKAGESRGIEVVYDPAAHGPAGVGPIDRFVYLVDSGGKMLELEIKATVTP